MPGKESRVMPTPGPLVHVLDILRSFHTLIILPWTTSGLVKM